MQWFIHKESDLEEVARYVVATYLSSPVKPLVLGLYGDLGAGKTTFTKYLARELGSTESVISPTFILERDYALEHGSGVKTLVHIDAYRFDDPQESNVLRLHERLHDMRTVFVIEWPEKMGDRMPSHVAIRFMHQPQGGRVITIEGV